MSVLVVVAHPDDEVLGAGGTIARLAAEGKDVRTCIFSGDVAARKNRPDLDRLLKDTRAAHRLLGVPDPILGQFPNIRFNTVAHLELVQFVEAAMRETQPRFVFTHHPTDLNDDHRQVSRACQAAVRLFQRGNDVPPLQGFYFMEILSSTDWAFPAEGESFRPDAYLEIGEDHLATKLKALDAYEGVMRDFPHPRSRQVVEGLAACRGGESGLRYAEAFQTAFQNLDAMNF